jgi:hypothetical protein
MRVGVRRPLTALAATLGLLAAAPGCGASSGPPSLHVLRDYPAAEWTIGDRRVVDELYEDLLRLPAPPRGLVCSAEKGTTLKLTFIYSGRKALGAQAEGYGCGFVILDGGQTKWGRDASSFWQPLARALGMEPRDLLPYWISGCCGTVSKPVPLG